MEKNKINTEQAILEAAEELFLENGYHGASTTMIAKKAGVTHAMLHYYYRTKEQIFLRIAEKNLDTMIGEMKSVMLPGRSFWDIIKVVTITHFDFLASNRRIPFLLLEMTKDFPEVVKSYKEKIASVVQEEMVRHIGRFDAESIKGKMNNVNPLQLLFTAVSLNMAPFLSIPFMENVMDMDEDGIAKFLESRKRENLEILYQKLFGKVNMEEL